MATLKVNKNIDFLVDEHENLVVARNPKSQTSADANYADTSLIVSRPNPVTGVIEIVDPQTGLPMAVGGGSVVSITGVSAVGSVLTAALASGWAATGYQWRRDGVAISGAEIAATLAVAPKA